MTMMVIVVIDWSGLRIKRRGMKIGCVKVGMNKIGKDENEYTEEVVSVKREICLGDHKKRCSVE